MAEGDREGAEAQGQAALHAHAYCAHGAALIPTLAPFTLELSSSCRSYLFPKLVWQMTQGQFVKHLPNCVTGHSQGKGHGPELPDLVHILLLEDGEVTAGDVYVPLSERMERLKAAIVKLPQPATAAA